MKTLRAAIIGCGGIHHVHAKTLADIPGVELAAGVLAAGDWLLSP